MKKRSLCALAIGLLALGLVGPAAAVIIYEEDFVANPGVGNGGGDVWDLYAASAATPPTFNHATDNTLLSAGAEAYNGAGGNPPASGEAQVTETAGLSPATDRLTTTDAGFLGDWSAHEISFDFLWSENDALNTSFGNLQVYFVGAGVTWYYLLDTTGHNEGLWRNYSANLANSAGWTDTGALGTFATSAAAVTEIGFRFTYIASSVNTLGFDNVRRGYSVPEPETYATIGFALVGLCIAFRRRLSDLFSVASAGVVS